jgi:hypothetical protein
VDCLFVPDDVGFGGTGRRTHYIEEEPAQGLNQTNFQFAAKQL